MGQVAVDWPEWPSAVPTEFDHHLSCFARPLNHREIDASDADAAGIRNSVEVRGEPRSLLVHGRHSWSSLVRPRYRLDWGCTVRTQQGVVGSAYTAAVLGDAGVVAVVADVVVVGGVEGGVEPVTGGVEGVVAHKNEAPVGLSDRTQDQVVDSVPSPVLGPVVLLSRPGSGGFE